MKNLLLTIVLTFIGFTIYAQSDTLWISEIEVTAKRTPDVYSEVSRVVSVITRAEINAAPARSLADLLEYAMNVDVRQRGFHGVQADISIRGGSFDQTLILINGIPFNDPQTGHHNGDLPIDLESIDRIEILEGPASRTFGPNAFSGAINIITSQGNINEFKLSLAAGEHQLYNTAFLINTNNNSISNGFNFSKKGSGGYIENTDYQILNLFYNSQIKLVNHQLTFQAATRINHLGQIAFILLNIPINTNKPKPTSYQEIGEPAKPYNLISQFIGNNMTIVLNCSAQIRLHGTIATISTKRKHMEWKKTSIGFLNSGRRLWELLIEMNKF